MNKLWLLALPVLAVAAIFYFNRNQENQAPKEALSPPAPLKTAASIKLLSPAFEANQAIPTKYTCDGGNISPPLMIDGVPQETQSLALVVEDPDAPGGTFTHWLVWNLDPATQEIAEGNVPAGAVPGTNDFGTNDYQGPCPPSGVHRYLFKLYALGQPLNLPQTSSKKDLEKAMEGHVLEKAELIANYKR